MADRLVFDVQRRHDDPDQHSRSGPAKRGSASLRRDIEKINHNSYTHSTLPGVQPEQTHDSLFKEAFFMATNHAAPLTEGAPVRLADREPSAADNKSGLFYPHYRSLTGTVAKLYADGTATVSIDAESLPTEIRTRHQAGTDAMRQKWLDGLSDEARNKLSAAEKKFSLRYNLLVGVADLVPADAPAPSALAPAPASSTPDAPAPASKRGPGHRAGQPGHGRSAGNAAQEHGRAGSGRGPLSGRARREESRLVAMHAAGLGQSSWRPAVHGSASCRSPAAGRAGRDGGGESRA